MAEGAGPSTMGRSSSLPEHLASIAGTSSSGTLIAIQGNVTRSFVFREGRPLGVQSNDEDERLGRWLVDRGMIRDGQRALALLTQSGAASAPLGEILVARNLIDEGTLHEEVRELWSTITQRAAASPATQIEYDSDAESDLPEPLIEIPTAQLALVAARAITDASEKTGLVGSLEQDAWVVDDINSRLEGIQLTPTEGFLLSRLSGRAPIRSIIAQGTLPEEAVIDTLYALKVIGFVKTSAASKPAARPAEAPKRTPVRTKDRDHLVDESELDEAQLEERARIRDLAESVTRVDHYEALELDRTANHEEIQRALRKKIREFSSMRLREPHLADLKVEFDAIVERARAAHELLSNAKSRNRYDRVLASVEAEETEDAKQTDRHKTDAGARREIVEANFARARTLVTEGEIHLAIKLLDHACKLEPRPIELVNLARLLLRNPQWTTRALNHLKKATEIDPFCSEAWIELAEYWRRRNQPSRQRQALEKALEAEPDNERAQNMFRFLVGKREYQKFMNKLP